MKRIIFSALLISFLAGLTLLGIFYIKVSKEAEHLIDSGIIDKVFASESPVFYDDGVTPIGVFFSKVHRKYVPYSRIPKHFIKALIASEDKNFFHHPGFDLKSILRAFIVNLKAGRIVQGGSTITQQLAKNVFKREKRSYISKLKELIQAMVLERRFSKEQILEFYANQFFVTGYGRGLGIASEYFFDKKPEELNLIESAFIAGALKGPYKYDPFSKKSEAEKEKAIRLAKMRKNYVLDQMFKLKFISEDEYIKAKEREIPFKQGQITYRLNVIMDYIRDQLMSDYFRNILREQGIENIATSGIRIFTSIDKEIQEHALESFQRNLPFLEVMLSGYKRDEIQKRYIKNRDYIPFVPVGDLPFVGKITHINKDKNEPIITVSWRGGGGIVDFQGMHDLGNAWVKSRIGPWAEFGKNHIKGFLENFKEGDLVALKYIKSDGDGSKRLMLTVIPKLEAGGIVLKDGMIKAMVGGYFNRFFNRAIDAKRQFGSVFKPILYTSSLQLRWNNLDELLNKRDIFSFENTVYVPRPDHEPKSSRVSLTWAGVKSENLASVWLLYHLTDKLNQEEFEELVKIVGLKRKRDESYYDYVRRIRDRWGIVVTRDKIMESAFERAKKEIIPDLIFEGYGDSMNNLMSIHYNISNDELKSVSKKYQKEVSRFSFSNLRRQNFEMKRILLRIKNKSSSTNDYLLNYFFKTTSKESLRIIFSKNEIYDSNKYNSITREELLSTSSGNIWIDDVLPSHILDLLQEYTIKNYRELIHYRRYDYEVLSNVRDFRTLVSLLYVNHLSKKIGIVSKLEPSLAFPLGPNSVSIAETTVAYQTLLTGSIFPFSQGESPVMIPIITKIEDRDGEVIWEYKKDSKNIINKKISSIIQDMLRLVVEMGTGKSARGKVKIKSIIEGDEISIEIPCYGKTGTANNFKNACFIGCVPAPREQDRRLSPEQGYFIGVYVGYDDNRPMKSKRIRIYGSTGALPLWIDIANGVVNSNEYKNKIEIADLVFDEIGSDHPQVEGLNKKIVSPVDGLPLENRVDEGVSIYYLTDKDPNILGRYFEPLRGENNDS